MYYVAITLSIPFLSIHFDLDLPWSLPLPLFLQSILPSLIQLRLRRYPQEFAESSIVLSRRVFGQRKLILTHTFKGAGVYDGDRLFVETISPPWPLYRFYLEEDLGLEGEHHLQTERIYLFKFKTLLGRMDIRKKQVPDVDLHPFAHSRRISRQHALIEYRKTMFTIVDLGSRNGTFLNGKRLSPQKRYPLKHGDRISFGGKLNFVFYDDALRQHTST